MSNIAKMIAIAKRFGGGSGSPSEVVILPETELTGEGPQYVLPAPFENTPTAGGTCKIVWDGVEYVSPALDVTETVGEGMPAFAFGDTSIVWGEEGAAAMGNPLPGAPIALMLVPNGIVIEEGEPTIYGIFMATTEPNNPILSIVQVDAASGGESAGGGSGVFRVNAVVGSGNAITSCDKTVQEVLAAIAAGKQCEAVLSSGTLTIYLQLAVDAISAHSSPGASNGVMFTALMYSGSAVLYNFTMYFGGNNTLDIKQF